MFQSGYLGVQAMQNKLPFDGGFCRYWYTPVENIDFWPDINPLNQWLSSDPPLLSGKTWYGPVSVPNTQIGYSELIKRSEAGIYYEQKIEGFNPGDSGTSRPNFENMSWHKYVIIGQQRAGGFFLCVGSPESPLTFSPDFKTGPGIGNAAGHTYSFTTLSAFKGIIIPQFNGIVSNPGIGGGGGGGTVLNTNQKDTITFTASDTQVLINWDNSHKDSFGDFPLIQVWEKLSGTQHQLTNVQILVDDAPPNTSLFTVLVGGFDGFIEIC